MDGVLPHVLYNAGPRLRLRARAPDGPDPLHAANGSLRGR